MYTVGDALHRNFTSPGQFERRQMLSRVSNGQSSSIEDTKRSSSNCETRQEDYNVEEQRASAGYKRARESRMAELDDIQRSMEHEEPQFQRYKPSENYSKEPENASTLRDSSFNHSGHTRTSSPPLEASFIDSAGTGERIVSHEWTFEEQFKQLYELGNESGRKEFLDDLFTFMQKRGTPVNRVPIMAKQTLDLFKLFQLVVDKGGLVEVINKKIWREIIKGLNLPASVTSAAFTLRTQYMKYLYPYECAKRKLSTPAELQAAIDGNRRDGRRTFGAFSSQGSVADGAHGFGSPSPPLSSSSFTANHSPTMVSVHRTSPGPLATPTDEVLVPPSVHGNNGVAVLHSPGVIHRLNPEYSPKHSSPVPGVVAQSPTARDQSPSGSPVKKFALSNEHDVGTERQHSFTKIKIETPNKASFTSLSVSSTSQSPDPSSTRGRDQRQLPLTHVDHVNENSLLVSVELNGTEYQGVLFARRRGRSGSSHE